MAILYTLSQMSRNLLRLEKGIMMKIEIEKDFPQYFKPAYPEEFELFSHFEVTAGIPTVLFAAVSYTHLYCFIFDVL